MRIPVLLCCIFFAAKAGGIFLVEDPWPPFTYGKHSHRPTGGLAVEAVQKIFEKQRLTLKLYPWQRAINMVKYGKADGMMLTVATSRRKNDFVFSKAIFHEPVVFVSLKKQAFVFESMADLRPVPKWDQTV
jgi:ABC-type amino acid transport substrate-binding protein